MAGGRQSGIGSWGKGVVPGKDGSAAFLDGWKRLMLAVIIDALRSMWVDEPYRKRADAFYFLISPLAQAYLDFADMDVSLLDLMCNDLQATKKIFRMTRR